MSRDVLRQAVLEEAEQLLVTLEQKRTEQTIRIDADAEQLAAMLDALRTGQLDDSARLQLRALQKRYAADDDKRDPKRNTQLKAQDVRVRMRAPADPIGAPPPRVEKAAAKPTLSRIIVQGSLQRELTGIESRIVELLVDEGGTRLAPEVCFLTDLRAGLIGLQREMPEHDVLLGLVNEHVESVGAIMKDLAQGGQARARRFFEHDRELLARLKAMLRAEGKKKGAPVDTVDRLSGLLANARKALEAGSDLAKVGRELEDTLMVIHRELEGQGFVAARSLLFNALRN